MSVDISGLSGTELGKLIREAQRRKHVLAKRQSPATVRARLTKIAAAAGYSIEELFGSQRGAAKRAPTTAKPAKRTRAKVAPKYRNPANPGETWTGRGKQPRWVAEALAGGATLESLLIPVGSPAPAKEASDSAS